MQSIVRSQVGHKPKEWLQGWDAPHVSYFISPFLNMNIKKSVIETDNCNWRVSSQDTHLVFIARTHYINFRRKDKPSEFRDFRVKQKKRNNPNHKPSNSQFLTSSQGNEWAEAKTCFQINWKLDLGLG